MLNQESRDMCTAMLRSVAHTAPKQVADFIRHLAEQGEIGTLELMLDCLPAVPAWPHLSPPVAYAIAPILGAASEHDRARALADRWIGAHKADSLKQIDNFLSHCKEAQVVRALITMHGRDLPDPITLARRVRSLASTKESSDLAAAIVEAAAGVGDFGPLEAAFEALAYTYGDALDGRLLDRVMKVRIPSPAPAGFARKAASIVANQHRAIEGIALFQRHAIVETWFAILARADVAPEDWRSLANAWGKTRTLFNYVCDEPKLAEHAGVALTKIIDAGVRPDEILADLPQKRDPVPMIHRAILKDNAHLVGVLLDAGADAQTSIKYRGKPQSAGEFAPVGSNTERVLQSARARDAMLRAASTPRCSTAAVPATH